MRQRITFFHHNEDAIEPSSLVVAGRSFSGPDIKAVREDRFTLGLEELPPELKDLLQVTHELHIRWSSPEGYKSLGPWNSRLSPGLHVFYTPQKDETATVIPSMQLCSLLRRLGVIDCSSPNESFTRLPNDRFSHSTAYQYYQPLEHLQPFLDYAAQYACSPSKTECKSILQSLSLAPLFDFSYDTISHVVKITALWKHGLQPLSLSSHPNHRVEVGLLTPYSPPNLEYYELGATGLLTVLGEDKEPAPTLFTFPSRHKQAGTSFVSQFVSPIGMHPTMRVLVKSSKPPVDDSYCSLHAYLTLPRTIFADKYQLEDPLFLASKNLTALRYTSQPVNLEAPDYVMKVWGSSILLELQPLTEENKPFTAEVPLHLRYKAPQYGGEQTFEVPYPAVFWACAAEEGTKFTNSPFDRVNLGFDGLFGPRTVFWHLDPEPSESNGRLMMKGSVPVLDLSRSASISMVTAAVVLAGFAWVVWKLAAVYFKTGHRAPPPSKETEKKTQ
ncbi:PIG-X protein [Pseudomassariella vexata]|uniref:Protein PBN1 n=1 Tax=Pseudomassariella vexata TaxID=1141098 RepID=A0A1Y2ED56_9PEZI|nr:PIG-X protein [Pseudomassariella vexata]ORY69513.1 PIG-X protein [Pseudomassariella vexata]